MTDPRLLSRLGADDVQACDVLVVGGGINGVGIARDLAGRGIRVILAEQDDLGAHTSSSSTKLIHGGLRYLEYYEFSLVRKALLEREVLLRSAPHIMWPLRFVMPHDPSMRPAWMIRLGLFFYDHLARREVLPGSVGVNLLSHPLGAPLQERFARGFVYSDGWVGDARLVVLNALDAQAHGARILTRTRCTAAQRSAQGWTATLRSADGHESTVTARALVNAAGPWAEAFLRGEARAAHGETLVAKSDPSVVTRDYMLESNTEAAPLLSVWGGKITTFRKLAEEAADEIGRMLGVSASHKAWTKGASLPGGDFSAWIGQQRRPDTDFERFVIAVQLRYPWLEPALVRRLARAYGSRIARVLDGASSRADLGEEVAPGLFEAELLYLRREEWACTVEDVLWRRTKRGLHFSEIQRQRVADWMNQVDEHRKVA